MKYAAEGFFLEKLFEKLNASNIYYAVMRNHEPLPYSADGSDLDIIVLPKDAERLKTVLYEVIKLAQGQAIGISETIGFFKIFAFGRSPLSTETWWGQRIDVNVGLYFQGQSQIAEQVLWPTYVYRNITVLSDGFSGVLGVLKEVLNNDIVPDRYITAARKGVDEEWSSIEICLAPIGEDALTMLRALISFGDVEQDRKVACGRFRKAFLRNAKQGNIVRYFAGRIRHEWAKIARYFKPSGKVVAILGVDGAGKSTIINAIKPILDAATHNATIIQHLRPGLLPPLARLKGKSAVVSGPVLDPHGAKPSGPLGSFFRLIYLIADYILGYWFKTRFQIAKQPNVMVFDRYAYDIKFDPYRFRIKLNEKIINIFIALVPEPDVIICLYGDAKKITIRKNELPQVEVERQIAALQAFSEQEGKAVLISTDGSIEESRDAVLTVLCNRFGQN